MRTSLAIVLCGLGAGCATPDRGVDPAREYLDVETRRLEDAWRRSAAAHRDASDPRAGAQTALLGAPPRPAPLEFRPVELRPVEPTADRAAPAVALEPVELAELAPPPRVPTEPARGPGAPAEPEDPPPAQEPAPPPPGPDDLRKPAEPRSTGSDTRRNGWLSGPWSAQREGGRRTAPPVRRRPARIQLPPPPPRTPGDELGGGDAQEDAPPPRDATSEPPPSRALQVHLWGGAGEVNGAFTWGPCAPFADDQHPTSHSDYEFELRPIASIVGLRLTF